MVRLLWRQNKCSRLAEKNDLYKISSEIIPLHQDSSDIKVDFEGFRLRQRKRAFRATSLSLSKNTAMQPLYKTEADCREHQTGAVSNRHCYNYARGCVGKKAWPSDSAFPLRYQASCYSDIFSLTPFQYLLSNAFLKSSLLLF